MTSSSSFKPYPLELTFDGVFNPNLTRAIWENAVSALKANLGSVLDDALRPVPAGFKQEPKDDDGTDKIIKQAFIEACINSVFEDLQRVAVERRDLRPSWEKNRTRVLLQRAQQIDSSCNPRRMTNSGKEGMPLFAQDRRSWVEKLLEAATWTLSICAWPDGLIDYLIDQLESFWGPGAQQVFKHDEEMYRNECLEFARGLFSDRKPNQGNFDEHDVFDPMARTACVTSTYIKWKSTDAFIRAACAVGKGEPGKRVNMVEMCQVPHYLDPVLLTLVDAAFVQNGLNPTRGQIWSALAGSTNWNPGSGLNADSNPSTVHRQDNAPGSNAGSGNGVPPPAPPSAPEMSALYPAVQVYLGAPGAGVGQLVRIPQGATHVFVISSSAPVFVTDPIQIHRE